MTWTTAISARFGLCFQVSQQVAPSVWSQCPLSSAEGFSSKTLENQKCLVRFALRQVFCVGTFKGEPAPMAAFFAFPKGADELPGLLHLHGGGQRAFLREVEFYAKRYLTTGDRRQSVV